MKNPSFFDGFDPFALILTYGSPLYVYRESIFRERCREMMRLVSYPNFSVNYSVKANTNLTLLKIAREEGLHADAMSPGEIFVEKAAGYTSPEIFFISNNASAEELRFAVDQGIMVSIDSISQLALYGRTFPHTKVALRINSGVGAGHSDKVVTGGHKTKFAILEEQLDEALAIIEQYDLTVAGLNQHIGSFVLDPETYLSGVRALLPIAMRFKDLEFIDLGGGFGMPYQAGQPRLDLKELGEALDVLLYDFAKNYGRMVQFKIEPGRYISAECCVLVGTVNALKSNGDDLYCGTDLGFNNLIRPVLYDAYHEVETLPKREGAPVHPYNVVGNICESGDIVAAERPLPEMKEGDLVVVYDTGAYGYSMSSQYNNRLRPAEVLLGEDGQVKLIRRRDTLEDLLRNFEV